MPQQQQQARPQAASKKQTMNNRPVHVVRFGAIKAAIWLNQTASGPIHNVTLSRSYKDGEEWRETGSFGHDDLLAAAKALDQAHSWIHDQRQRDRAAPADAPPSDTTVS